MTCGFLAVGKDHCWSDDGSHCIVCQSVSREHLTDLVAMDFADSPTLPIRPVKAQLKLKEKEL